MSKKNEIEIILKRTRHIAMPHKGLLAGIGLVSTAVIGGVGYIAGKSQERSSWAQRVSNSNIPFNGQSF